MSYVLLPISVILISTSSNIFRANKWFIVFESYYCYAELVCFYKHETHYLFSNPRFCLLCAVVGFVVVHEILFAWAMELVFLSSAFARFYQSFNKQ